MHIYDSNIDLEIKKKGIFVLKAKGSSLASEVKKLLEENAKEYEKLKGE